MDCCPDASIVHHFKDLKDPRIERTKKHRLIDIIVIALGSIMVGGDGFQDMELFGQSKRAWLERAFSTYPTVFPLMIPLAVSFLASIPSNFFSAFYPGPNRYLS